MRAKKNHCVTCGSVCCKKRTKCSSCARPTIILTSGFKMHPIKIRKAA